MLTFCASGKVLPLRRHPWYSKTMDKHLPKDGVGLPKPGTAARYVVDQWASVGRMRWSDLMGIYLFRLRLKNPRKQECYASINLNRILRAHGFKEGKSGDRSDWVYGARFPTPGTFSVGPAPTPPPSILPASVPAHVFGVGDMVTCHKIGRAVVAQIESKTADGFFRIKWPNGLHDNVPGDLLQLVSPAEPEQVIDPMDEHLYEPLVPEDGCPVEHEHKLPEVRPGLQKPAEPEYKSEKTKRLERELEESIQSDRLKRWARAAAEALRDELPPEKYAALAEEMVDG